MMRLTGPALETIRAVLGLEGRGSQVTEFPDGILDQVLDTNPLVRRGLTRAPTRGLAYLGMNNVHATGAASTVTAELSNPHELGPGITGYKDFWPSPFPLDKYDVWVLHTIAINTVGSGNLASFSLVLGAPDALQVAGVSADLAALPIYHGTGEFSRNGTVYLDGGTSRSSVSPMPFRLHPRQTLTFATTTAAAPNSTYRLTVAIGLFPAGLGQDLLA